MEVTRNAFIPGDPRLTDSIVYELKSQGIFDNFRKECISDVDTKPAYQNLRQRVEGSVTGFLKAQQWNPNMNKNQVREMLRKTISESGFLETGVERIVEQVVNPKINSVFFPQVENIVYTFLGINKPSGNNSNNLFVQTPNITTAVGDLLPKNLEAISPNVVAIDKVPDIIASSDCEKVEEKIDEEESPPFEAIDDAPLFPPLEESSSESHLSGISGITSHDSHHSFGLTKAMANEEPPQNDTMIKIFEEVVKQESFHNSKDSLDSMLHIPVTTDLTKSNMDVNEDSNYSRYTSDIMGSNSNSFDNILAQEVTLTSDAVINYNNSDNEPINNIDKLKISDTKHHSGEKYKLDKQHRSSSSKDHTGEKDRKSDSYRSDSKYKSKHSSRSSNDREKEIRSSKSSSRRSDTNSQEKEDSRSKSKRNDSIDRDRDEKYYKSNTKTSDTKSHEDKKSDKHYSRSKHSSSHHNRDRSAKVSEINLQKADMKATESHIHKHSFKKDDNCLQSDKINNKEATEKGSSKKSNNFEELSKDKESKTKAFSKHGDPDNISKERKTEKFDNKRSSNDSKHSRDHSHHKSHSESRRDSKSNHSSRDKSDSRNHSKIDDKTKSGETVSKSSHRHEDKHRSRTDKHSSYSKRDKHEKDRKQLSKDDHQVSKEKKYHRRSTDRDSSDGRSGTYSSSSSFGDTYSSSQLQKPKDESSKINSGSNSGDSGNSDEIEDNQNAVEDTLANFQQVKLIKPKFASNVFEARKLLKIRKEISKLEKQNNAISNNSSSLDDSILATDPAKEKLKNQESNKTIECIPIESNLKKSNSSNSIKENIKQNESTNILEPLLKAGHSKKNVNKTKTVLHSVNIRSSHENNKNLSSTSLPTNEYVDEKKVIDSEKSPSPLRTSVISKESWDAIEAKLNSANILNVDYNSYVDTSEYTDDDCSLPLEIKDAPTNFENFADNESANIAQGENPSNISKVEEITKKQKSEKTVDTDCSQSKPSSSFDEKVEVPKATAKDETETNCFYLVPEVLPERQKYFDKVAYKIALLEEEIAKRTELLILNMENQKKRIAEAEIQKRLPNNVDIVDVNNANNETVIVPSKSSKREIKNHQRIEHNNKRKLEFTEVDEVNDSASIQTSTVHTSEKVTPALKPKKIKNIHNSIGDFSLPLSPADSEHSVSSNSEKPKPNIRTSARRTGARHQSYSNEDLYKPRLRFTSSRRRFDANAASNNKK